MARLEIARETMLAQMNGRRADAVPGIYKFQAL